MRQDELTRNLRTLLATHDDLQLAILFGSVASGIERTDSDIDIALQASHLLTSAEKMALIEKIANLCGRPVDLVDLRTAGEPLLGEILRGQRLLGTDEAFARLLTRHLIDAADFLPLQQRILKERRDAWTS